MQDTRAFEASVPLAVVDIGSNSFRLEIGQLERGGYRRIDYVKETVRLGAGLDADGRLTDAAAQRGLDCLLRFAERLRGFASWQVRAVATQTLREASNRDEFLRRAAPVLGHDIEVISGREEARLIYAGVALLQPPVQRRLVIDIGGRSTELILGHRRTPLAAESFPVGSVGLSMRCFADGRLSAGAFRKAQIAAGAEIEESLATFAPVRWKEALGSSGTVSAVSQVLAAEGVTDGRITPAALAWCIERCVEAGHVDQLKLASLRDDRRPVIAGGLSILYTLCSLLGVDSLQPARGALRHGMIVELDARLKAARHEQPLDLRDTSVHEMQARFGVDRAQAHRVQHVAIRLFDQIAGNDFDVDTRRDLGWAAALHEVGKVISHHDHHRHSAYVLANADVPGFSQSHQRHLSVLVLGQRGRLRKVDEHLSAPPFAWQLLCLRLGVIACHARRDPPAVGHWRLLRDGKGARLAVGAGDADPRTLYLLREEVAHWQRRAALTLVLDAPNGG